MFDFLKKIKPFKALKKWVFKHTVPEIIDSLEIKVETISSGRNKAILVKVEIFGIKLIEESFKV